MRTMWAIGWLGIGALIMAQATTVHGLEATLQDTFDPGVGLLDAIGVDETTGTVYVHNRLTNITVLQPDGTVVGTLPTPGNQSNDFDLDSALRELVIGGTTVPAGTLLVFNGDDSPDRLYGLDPSNGAVLASVGLPTVFLVGGADAPARDAVVAVNYVDDSVLFVDPNDGSLLDLYTLEPSFDVNYGDIDYATASGHVFVVSSNVPAIREVDDAGYCVRDIDLSHLGLSQISGIALDETRGDYWLASASGSVHRVRVEPTIVDAMATGCWTRMTTASPRPMQTRSTPTAMVSATPLTRILTTTASSTSKTSRS